MKLGILWMVWMLAFACLSVQVSAGTSIDVDREGSFSLTYPCSDTEFQIYRIAELSESAQITLTKEFAKYPVHFTWSQQEQWGKQAETLAAYVHRDQLTPYKNKKTDAKRIVQFSNLKTGLYLVVGEQKEKDGFLYTPMPWILSIPMKQKDSIVYDGNVNPKYERQKISQKKVDYEVIKVWEDDGYEEKRPKSIQVELLRDGELYGSVTLNEKNGWSHTWKDLSNQYHWQVAEKIDNAYIAEVSKEGDAFIITNTYKKETAGSGEKKEGEHGGKSTSKLPQTGQLWWPVPILSAAGCLSLLIGIMIRRKKHEKA